MTLCRIAWCAYACSVSRASPDFHVDLSSTTEQLAHRAAGVLHSLSAEMPDDSFVAPLKLQLFRGNAEEIVESAARLHALGVQQVQVVVSDTYGYDGPWPGDDGSYSKWDQVIDEVVAKVAGVDGIAFDIWNEPNGGIVPQMKDFWKPSKQQFFETWEHGVRRLRTLVPNATIVGPSSNNIGDGLIFGRWGQQWMHDFLIFAHENDVMPDVVSWHELLPSSIEPRHGHILMDETQKLRSWMAENNIPSRPLSINEYTPQDANTKPGTTAGFIAALERSEVASAAHSCWDDDQSCGDDFASNCWSGTLDGLLSCPSRTPRATWWVYAAYGNMTGTKVTFDRNSNIGDGIAVLDGSAARILVGTYASRHKSILMSVTSIPEEMQLSSSVFVTIRRISGTDWNPLSEPDVVLAQVMDVASGELILSLDAQPEDAFTIEVTQPRVVL